MSELKRAMVTGATGGIGKGFAQRLAHDGWALTLMARDRAALTALMAELPGSGHDVLSADLGTDEGVKTVSERLAAQRYHLLINNAGFGLYGRFTEIPLAKQRDMIRLNCEALMALAHAFLSASQPGDTLLNTASTLGLTGLPAGGVYAATKAFVISLSEALWYEQRTRNVNVIGLCPGATRTPFHKNAGAADASPFPDFIFQNVDDVVETGVKAIFGRKPGTRVSGLLNALLVGFARVMPRTWMVRVMGAFAPKTGE